MHEKDVIDVLFFSKESHYNGFKMAISIGDIYHILVKLYSDCSIAQLGWAVLGKVA